MYGRRARIGLVVPSSNTTSEPEIGRLLPDGVDAYATRVLQREETEDAARETAGVLAMRAELGRAVDELATLQPVAVGFASTAASFLNGAVDDRETCSVLSFRARCPVVTASRSVVLALRALGVRRVALATPYPAGITDWAVSFLAEEGLDTVSAVDLGLVGSLARGRLPVGAAENLALRADVPAAEAVLVVGTNWRTLEALPGLERRLGKPVLSSNGATGWALLRRADVTDRLPALGRLGTCPAPVD
jgi:maleate cis-trans isomerase